jgi:hypothetical protein
MGVVSDNWNVHVLNKSPSVAAPSITFFERVQADWPSGFARHVPPGLHWLLVKHRWKGAFVQLPPPGFPPSSS